MASFVRNRRREGGYAIILAIVVLAALVAIATPFLLTTRGSARSSVSRAGSVRARIETDAALRALVRRLEATDPEADPTPLFDTEDEVRPVLALPKAQYPSRDPRGTIVSGEAEPEQLRVDANSASVYAFGLLFGHGFLSSALTKEATEVSVDSAEGFPEEGYVWIEGELIRYRKKQGGQLLDVQRGVMGSKSGPYDEPGEHKEGTPVVDARAYALVKHRLRAAGEFRKYGTVGELARAAVEPADAVKITPEDVHRLAARLTVHSERNGHGDWSAPVRVTSAIPGDGLQRDLLLESGRYLGVGTTVRLEGPSGVEYGIVARNLGDRVILAEPPRLAAQAYEASASFLVPHPIHANSASLAVLEDLFTGLYVRFGTTRDAVSREGAREIGRRLRERPVTGWKSFLEQVLLPLGNESVLSLRQIDAVLRNAENSNDGTLGYSTLPLTFTAGSRFRLLAAAAVNAPSGAERGREEIEEVVEVHRQNHDRDEIGLRLVARQAEFDELFRLSRRGRGWMTYPWNSTYFDGRAEPPSRARAYLQTLTALAGDIPPVQSEEPENSWAQLWPARTAYPDQKSQHFDADLSPEGHDVTKLQPWAVDPAASPADLVASSGYLYPGSFSGWFRWEGGAVTGTLFDLGSKDSYIRDRITLTVDGNDLVLRMRDPAGDDANNVAGEIRNEIRYPLTQLSANVWYHFTVAWRGSGPNDFALFVDGIPRGRRTLSTQLTADLSTISQSHVATSIPVESTEGFPGYGVLQIGDELVEYTGKSGNQFTTAWLTGAVPGAYTGGRGVRHTKATATPGLDHKAGETVSLYGYVNRIVRDVQPGGGQLPGTIGRFSAAHVAIQQSFSLAPIDVAVPGAPGAGGAFPLGRGIKGSQQISSLKLAPLDPSDTDFVKAFPPGGGYAVLFQFASTSQYKPAPPENTQLFGAELIFYSGVQGTDTLTGIQRGVSPGGNNNYFLPTTFVVEWNNNVPANHNNNDYRFWVYVVPCSIPITGGTYENPSAQTGGLGYAVAQLVELGAQGVGIATTTEWVSYDTILNGTHLCRLDPNHWNAARAITLGPPQVSPNLPGQQPPLIVSFAGAPIPQPTPAPIQHTPQESVQGHYLGEPPTKPTPGLVEWMATGVPGGGGAGGLFFRGTHQTWSREHTGSTEVIPAFLTKLGTHAAGRPGRLDRFRIVLPKGVNGFDHRTINWTALYSGGAYWVAPAERLPATLIPVPAGNLDPEHPNNVASIEDSRDWTRLVVGPSGELPAVATQLSVGAAYDGSGSLFPGLVDEVEFTAVPAGQRTLSLGRFLVDQPVSASANSIQLSPVVGSNPFNAQSNPIANGVSFPGATKTLGSSSLGVLPADAGVLLVGHELVGYEAFDPGSGAVTVAPNGRGLLGTEATAHGRYETAVFLDHLVVSQLSATMAASSSAVSVEDSNKFPFAGTLLVEGELLHYTRNTGARLEMPEYEADLTGGTPGETSISAGIRRGDGLFRARYGTAAAQHTTGALAIRFPFRYWDRWVQGSDAPEVHSLQCDEEASSAFWRRVFWKEEDPVVGVTIECVARLDARSPWAALPGRADGLWLFTSPNAKDASVGDGNAILRQGERLELRFGARFGSTCFDPIVAPITNDTKRADGWKATPRLRAIAVERFAANRVLWKEERR